jgi:nitrogen fixation protein FixH
MSRSNTMGTTSWRWFPAWLIFTMGLVFAVNAYMVYTSLSTFPGEAGTDGFDLSNGYGRILDSERVQAALGWHVDASVDTDRRPLLLLTDQAGNPINDLRIEAIVERPVGPPERTTLSLQDLGDGRLRSDTTLFSGQWDLLLTVHSGEHVYATTRRLIVR